MRKRVFTNAPTRQEARFAEAVVSTNNPVFAASAAGYAQPPSAATKLMARPTVIAEIRRVESERLFGQLLPAALDLLQRVLTDDKENSRTRVAAAKIVLDRTLGAADLAADAKEPHEMTADELAARILRLRQRQAELAEGARDVTPAGEEPDEGGVFD